MYKYKCRISCAIAAGIAPIIFGGQVASAGLLSSVNYNQVVIVEGPGTSSSDFMDQVLSGSTLPLSTSQTASLTDGLSSTANYSYTDTGTVATFNVNCTGILTALDQSASEGSYGPIDITFVLAQPASYTVNLTSNMSSGTQSSTNIGLESPHSEDNFAKSSTTGDPLSSSGTLSSGITYTFFESWSIGNTTQSGGVAAGRGSDSMTLTLTAVPEPSSLCLLTLAGASFLTCRRKRFYV